MSPKKTILRELSQSYETNGGDHFTRPATIDGFSQEPDKYQKAVNELLAARLVDGHKDQEGNMVVAINAHRLPDVKKELRPAWAHPAVWVVLVLVVAAAGLGFGA